MRFTILARMPPFFDQTGDTQRIQWSVQRKVEGMLRAHPDAGTGVLTLGGIEAFVSYRVSRDPDECEVIVLPRDVAQAALEDLTGLTTTRPWTGWGEAARGHTVCRMMVQPSPGPDRRRRSQIRYGIVCRWVRRLRELEAAGVGLLDLDAAMAEERIDLSADEHEAALRLYARFERQSQ